MPRSFALAASLALTGCFTGAAPSRTLPSASLDAPVASEPTTAPATTPAAPVAVDQPAVRYPRGRFSGKRLLVTALVGGVAGGALGYLTYSKMCTGDDGCMGPALAGLGVNMVATPLIVYGVGTAMGGRGGIGATYLGALAPFGVSVAPGQEAVAFAVGTLLMPFGAAAFYEVSSHMRSQPPPVTLNAQPLTGADGKMNGAYVGFSGRF